ncbi:hypothetical protein DB346_10425 [Verrucomicrobia bacterium LW23]|nr:hypothetical protein DB346_10425 [Verrucomicrobia bacterium LW23]
MPSSSDTPNTPAPYATTPRISPWQQHPHAQPSRQLQDHNSPVSYPTSGPRTDAAEAARHQRWTTMATRTSYSFFTLMYQSVLRFYEDNGPRMSAALAYYTVFSIPGMLFIAIAVAGSVFGQAAAEKELHNQIVSTVGKTAADAIEGMVSNTNKPGAGIMATVVGLATLIFGGSGVFLELQSSLNIIWRVPTSKYATVAGFIWQRVVSFLMVFGIGLILLASLVLSATVSAVGQFVQANLPGVFPWMRLGELSISFISVLALFAMIYKIIPDRRVLWSDVWLGATVTAVLFTFGKYGIGLYLAHSSVSSTYGAAGSIIIILIWVYFSAQILLLGAEQTYVYARDFGSLRTSHAHARKLDQTGSVSALQEAEPEGTEAAAEERAEAAAASSSSSAPSTTPRDRGDTVV